MDIQKVVPNYKGEKCSMRAPKGVVLAVACDGYAYLEQTSSHCFTVVYGLQVTTYSTLQEAITDLQGCMEHWSEWLRAA